MIESAPPDVLRAIDRLSDNANFKVLCSWLEAQSSECVQRLFDHTRTESILIGKGYAQAMRDVVLTISSAKTVLARHSSTEA